MSAELEEVTHAVAEFDRVGAGLAQLRQKYEGVVYDVTTPVGMKDAKEARAAIREPRFEVERIRKAAKAPILALGRKLDSEAARITSELLKLEEPVDSAIKAEEARKETERQEKIAAEMKRVADLQERMAELRGCASLSPTSGSSLIAEHIADLEAVVVDESFEEFRAQAQDAKSAGLARLRELHAGAIAHETEQERLRQEREELARLRAEEEARQVAERARIAEEQRRLAAERAEQEAETRAERERLAAEERRLAEERAAIERRECEAHEAEERRLAVERAEAERKAREEAAARARQERRRRALENPPAASEIAEVLAEHYEQDFDVVMTWLANIDFGSLAEVA